jgi:drug/metabolite transporter (DMT)-like permease
MAASNHILFTMNPPSVRHVLHALSTRVTPAPVLRQRPWEGRARMTGMRGICAAGRQCLTMLPCHASWGMRGRRKNHKNQMTSSTTSSGPTASSAIAGIGLMLASIAVFSINDALGKWLLATYSVGELLLVRSAAALLLLAPFIRQAGMAAFTRAPRPGLQIVRVLLSTLEVAMFFWAVSYLPLADTVTFYLAGPIYVTALSVILLGEKVGWRRWTAVIIGFAGVLLAMRPSAASFTLPALIALIGSIFFACLMIATRLLRETSNTVLIAGQIGGTLLFGAVAAPFAWVMPSPLDFALLALFGVLSIMALACVNLSLKLAAASVVVPYQYTIIVWAIVLGYVVFGDVPDAFTLAGAAIIIMAGLYIFWREQMRGEQEAPPSVHP